MSRILKYKFTLSYVLLVLLVGLWSILDWKYGCEDPLWHLVFYIIIIPILSFIYGVIALKEIKLWLIPFIVFTSITIIWLVFENGGLTFDIEGLHIVSIPSIVASIVGIIFRKIYIYIKEKSKL